MRLSELVKEGWLSSSSQLDRELTQKEIDELVFYTWGWAKKLNVKELKNNQDLVNRAKNTDFSAVIEDIKKRIEKQKINKF